MPWCALARRLPLVCWLPSVLAGLRGTLPRGPAAETSPHSESVSTGCPGTAPRQWPFLPFPFQFLHEILSSPPCSLCTLLLGYPSPRPSEGDGQTRNPYDHVWRRENTARLEGFRESTASVIFSPDGVEWAGALFGQLTSTLLARTPASGKPPIISILIGRCGFVLPWDVGRAGRSQAARLKNLDSVSSLALLRLNFLPCRMGSGSAPVSQGHYE